MKSSRVVAVRKLVVGSLVKKWLKMFKNGKKKIFSDKDFLDWLRPPPFLTESKKNSFFMPCILDKIKMNSNFFRETFSYGTRKCDDLLAGEAYLALAASPPGNGDGRRMVARPTSSKDISLFSFILSFLMDGLSVT